MVFSRGMIGAGRVMSATGIAPAMISFSALSLALNNNCNSVTQGCSPKASYPSLNIWDMKEDPAQIPMAGKAVVDYRVRRKTLRVDSDGKKSYDAEIEVRSIDPVEDVKAVARTRAFAMGLSRGVIGFDRSRTADGTFAPESGAEGPDPAAMKLVYGTGGAGEQAGGGGGSSASTEVSVAFRLANALRERGYGAA